MHVPVVEIVLLFLLMVFFGIQQRHRPQLYFRVWTVAWILVFLSLTVWVLDLGGESARVAALWEVLRLDLLLLAGLAFTVSPVLTRVGLRKMLLQIGILLLPLLVGLNLQMMPGGTRHELRVLEFILVMGSEMGAIALVQFTLPSYRTLRKPAVMLVTLWATVWILKEIIRNPEMGVVNIVLAQVFLYAAIYYFETYGRTLAGGLGAVGFAVWGLLYVLPGGVFHGAVSLQLFWMVWNVPKYFVGFSMAMRVLEVDGEEKARLVEQLQVLYSDFKGLYESHPHAIWIHDGAEERFLATNPAAQEIYGFTQEEFLSMRPIDLQAAHDDGMDEFTGMLPPAPDGVRIRHQRKDGSHLWMNLVERPIVFQGREARMVLARDITERLVQNRQLAFQAHHDPLTGLPNRVLLEERLQQALEAARRDGRRATVLAIDVDHFKSVNDTHGHIVGDACLQAVAARLQSRIRQSDTIARTGGEEFIAVIGRLQSPEDARKVALSLLGQFDARLKLDDCELSVTVSIGVAVYPEDGLTGAELRTRADKALYEAKRRGRACVVMAGEKVRG